MVLLEVIVAHQEVMVVLLVVMEVLQVAHLVEFYSVDTQLVTTRDHLVDIVEARLEAMEVVLLEVTEEVHLEDTEEAHLEDTEEVHLAVMEEAHLEDMEGVQVV